ncbi:MAG: L-threonylcarbamoyladenylate synthase [Rothia sp. (in: high G+C Gram-positive bacteria)]|nr:L-threonylcarbamoyladenylate synthase [Rothia sp. (in: high G+C Gram-positive bacteria)]
MNATVYSTDTDETRLEAIMAAQTALRDKQTIVIPTDTVYGIAADAFSPEAVEKLLAAKGRSRTMPPPVLIFDEAVLPGLADEVSGDATALAREFWPGALTLILYSQPSLNWDLGQTQGTVALRVPDDPLAIELLRQSGPLAVSSANKTGLKAATTAQEAAEQLGQDVELILDGGPRPLGEQDPQEEVLPSTIVDCTSKRLVLVRQGAISLEQLRRVVPSIISKEELEAENRAASARQLEQEPLDQEDLEDSGDQEQSDSASSGQAGLRASAPAPGSLNSRLLASAPAATGVDQIRSKQAYRMEQQTQPDYRTKPLSVSQAQALVFAGQDKKEPLEEQ